MSYNRKIRNATKVEVEGVKYASRLELYAAEVFKNQNIEYDFQVTYELQPKFKYAKESIRNISIIVDFYLPKYDVLTDTKGWQLTDSKLKHKMLKYTLHQQGKTTPIILLKNKKEVNAFVYDLKAGKYIK